MDGEGGRLLDEADRLRDARDWGGAARLYAEWLATHPQDWAIWIQHGHCVKEQGDPDGALASYRQAERGLPRDADLQMQIGHALKRAGDLAGARAAYGKALELSPDSEAAWREVSQLLGEATAAAALPADGLTLLDDLAVVFDLSDLLSWFGANRAPSGIQRVQLEIVAPALRPGAAAGTVLLAVFNPGTATWRPLPREVFLRLAALSRSGGDPFDPTWEDAVTVARQALDAAPDLAFPEGAWLVNPGTSWWLPDYHLAVRAARARFGIRYAALVHDCGPLVLPEHASPELVADFARWFSGIGAHADLLLAVSESTKGDLERLRAALLPGMPAPPVVVLKLDAAPPRRPPVAAAHPSVAALSGRPYALFVGTLESRKNHLFVLNAWLAMIRRHGAARMPLLVLAGRSGFNAEPVLALLRNAPSLRDGAVLLQGVPDADLPGLYGGALFCLYNSHHEGWGLPVTEALAHGKAVLAPDHTGLLEAGLGLALHFRHQSEPDFIAKAERLAFDAPFRATQEAAIAKGLRLRSWQAISDSLLSRLARTSPGKAQAAATLPLGGVQGLGLLTLRQPGPALALADLLRGGTNWHAPEEWGCWTRPGRAQLRLPLDVPSGTRLRIHLMLRGPAAPQRLRLLPRGAEPLMVELAAGARSVAALEVTMAESVLEIGIDAPAAPDGGAEMPREVGVGLVSVMACRTDDLLARLDYLERQRFVWPELES